MNKGKLLFCRLLVTFATMIYSADASAAQVSICLKYNGYAVPNAQITAYSVRTLEPPYSYPAGGSAMLGADGCINGNIAEASYWLRFDKDGHAAIFLFGIAVYDRFVNNIVYDAATNRLLVDGIEMSGPISRY